MNFEHFVSNKNVVAKTSKKQFFFFQVKYCPGFLGVGRKQSTILAKKKQNLVHKTKIFNKKNRIFWLLPRVCQKKSKEGYIFG